MATRSNASTRGTARRWKFGGPGLPPVRLDQIRGTKVTVSTDLIWPALTWLDGRCWCHLHDLEPRALARVMDELRETELERSAPHGVLRWT